MFPASLLLPAEILVNKKVSVARNKILCNSGNMRLKAWLKSKKVTQREFADALATNVATVNRTVNGKTLPKPEMMLKIQALTNGKVKPFDLFHHWADRQGIK